jgi:hypothetical protein
MRPPRTGFAGPLKGALPVAPQSRLHGSRARGGGAPRAWETQATLEADHG